MEVLNAVYTYIYICIYILPVWNGMTSANSAVVGMKYEIEASKEMKNAMQAMSKMKSRWRQQMKEVCDGNIRRDEMKGKLYCESQWWKEV